MKLKFSLQRTAVWHETSKDGEYTVYTYRQTDTALITLIALQTLYNQTWHKQDEWPRGVSAGTGIGYLAVTWTS